MFAGDVVHDATVAPGDKGDVSPHPTRPRERGRELVNEWEADGEGAAGPGIVPDADGAVMLLDDPTGDREAESGALVRPSWIRLVKALEDSLQIGGRDPNAIVGDGQQHGRIVLPEPDFHRATWLRELHPVVDQDPQELDDGVRVALDARVRQPDAVEAPVLVDRLRLPAHGVDQRPQRDWGELEGLPGIRLSQGEQMV